jgi:hypothetical protein
MRRPALQLSSVLVLVGALSSAGCATYRQDLERARAHYDKNEYEPALALFRVLEFDLDSFNDSELSQYAYSRGMTDYRLASLVTTVSSVADPKQAYRSNARHWLAFAHAVEDKTPGGLTGDEKQRLDEALVDLNRDVYGGGEAAPPAKSAAGAAKPDK